jgi:hypothetical protein
LFLLAFLFACSEIEGVDTNLNTGECEVPVSEIAMTLNKEQREVATTIETELSEMEISDNLIAAAIVNAVAESNLNPDAIGDGGKSVGAFQLNKFGLGNKLTVDQRTNTHTSTNIIGVQILKNRKLLNLEYNGASIPYLTQVMVEDIFAPSNIIKEKQERAILAREMFPDRI